LPVLDSDDGHSLAARILELEHIAYTEAVRLVLSGEVEVQDRKVVYKKHLAEGG
jgi:phosphoribosylglycinamide formyltransferase-1